MPTAFWRRPEVFKINRCLFHDRHQQIHAPADGAGFHFFQPQFLPINPILAVNVRHAHLTEWGLAFDERGETFGFAFFVFLVASPDFPDGILQHFAEGYPLGSPVVATAAVVAVIDDLNDRGIRQPVGVFV